MQRWWFLVLLLLSAAALLGLGLWSLWQSARVAEDQARSESLAAARARAENLARSVRSAPAEIEGGYRFRVADGQIVIPQWVGWLDEAPQREPSRHWYRLRLQLERAVADGLPLDDVLTQGDLDEDDLVLAAHWRAFRALRENDAAGAAAILEAAPVLALDGDLLMGRLLLSASLDREVDDDEVAAAAAEPELLVAAVLARLRARGGAAALIERLESSHARVTAERGVLRRVADRLPLLMAGAQGEVLADGSDLVLYWSEDEATGSGVLIAPSVLLASLGVAQDFHVGERRDDGEVEALPLIFAVPREVDAVTGASRLAILLVLLAATFVSGLVLTLRAVRREALAAKTRAEFLTSVTHELKTPLASIRLLSEMLEEGRIKGEEKRLQYYRLLSGEAARLTMLIENVLDLRRLERGERSYDRRHEDLTTVVDDAVRLFAPVAEKDGLAITARLDVESAVDVDRGALVQALLNVMENARKYAREGERLDVDVARETSAAVVRLRDYGPGIAPSEAERIFERFRRGEAQADGRIPGVGLGLHLARRILRDHGGELAVETPEEGEGACFVVTLPLREDES